MNTTLATRASTIPGDATLELSPDTVPNRSRRPDRDRRSIPETNGASLPATLLRRWQSSRRFRLAVYVGLALQAALAVGFAAIYRPFDLEIYLWGGHAVTHGLQLYLVQSHANWFTYPPFAAALFTPVGWIPALLGRLLWELASVAAFGYSCWVTLRLAGYRPCRSGLLAITGAGLMLEPVYHTLFLGQVNLFLLALVLTDVWLVARGRHAGIAIGIATAIKLIPGIFIILLLLARRTRDAMTAVASLCVCTLIGFAVDPAASKLYWTRLFYDTTRVSATYISNQSPYAAIARSLGGVEHVGAWYYLVPAVLGVAGLAIGAVLARRGDWLGAAAATGITGLLVSPISWTHHWVWIMPALVVLARGGRRCQVAAVCGYLLFALAPMWWTPHAGHNGDYGVHGLVTLIANCFLIYGLAFLAWLGWRIWSPASRHGGTGEPVAGDAPRVLETVGLPG